MPYNFFQSKIICLFDFLWPGLSLIVNDNLSSCLFLVLVGYFMYLCFAWLLLNYCLIKTSWVASFLWVFHTFPLWKFTVHGNAAFSTARRLNVSILRCYVVQWPHTFFAAQLKVHLIMNTKQGLTDIINPAATCQNKEFMFSNYHK